MKYLKYSLLFLIIAFYSFAFEIDYVDSLSGQRRDGSKLYDIYFNIYDLTDSLEVNLVVITDSGDSLNLETFSSPSDTGRIYTSGLKHIIWNIGEDIPDREFYTDSIRIRIMATEIGFRPDDCYSNGFCNVLSDGSDKIPFAIGELGSDNYYLFMVRQISTGGPSHIAFSRLDSVGIDELSYTFATFNSISNPQAIKKDQARFLISGATISDSVYASDILLCQIDTSMHLEFAYTFYDSVNPSSIEISHDIAMTESNDIFLAGQYSASTDSASSILLMNLDSLANINWAKKLGGPGHEEFPKISYSNVDSAIYLSAHTSGFHGGGISIIIMKLSLDGDLIWSKNIYDTEILFNDDIVSCTDGGCIVLAHRPSTFDILVMKLDSVGEMLWSKAIGGDFMADPYRIETIEPSGYLVSAYTRTGFDAERHALLYAIDNSGNLSWQRIYDYDLANTTSRAICQNSDGTFITAHTYITPSGSSENILITKSAEIPNNYFCCMYEPLLSIRDIVFSSDMVYPETENLHYKSMILEVEISNTDFYQIRICE
ncbi:MAG: hypothetical protein ACLFSQ_02665 [Candidatus Zixiibacteriota bacterium]